MRVVACCGDKNVKKIDGVTHGDVARCYAITVRYRSMRPQFIVVINIVAHLRL